jgi:hypothetical protein
MQFRILRMHPVTRDPRADAVCVSRELSRWDRYNRAGGMGYAVPADFGCQPPHPAACPASPDDKQIAGLACGLGQNWAGVPAHNLGREFDVRRRAAKAKVDRAP